jgi:peptidoglycan/LPS O-acetylase OafA/YrhL
MPRPHAPHGQRLARHGDDFQTPRSASTLAIFLVTVTLLALPSHRFLERPTQGWIRRRSPGRQLGDLASTSSATVPAQAPSV